MFPTLAFGHFMYFVVTCEGVTLEVDELAEVALDCEAADDDDEVDTLVRDEEVAELE